MFRRSDPQQPLFDRASDLDDAVAKRLKASWASGFRREVLPVLMEVEPQFAHLYSGHGRPNFSVARLLGVCLLKEMKNLTDQDAVESFAFDARWQYALDVVEADAYISRRSLVEFRRRLVENDPEMELIRSVFDRISARAIAQLGLCTAEQRVDSTIITSNIRVGGTLDLFRSCLEVFLRSLDEERMARVPEDIRAWYCRDRQGWFGSGASEIRDKLETLVQMMASLLSVFGTDEDVKTREPFRLLKRAFDENCRYIEPQPTPASGADDDDSKPQGSDDSGATVKGMTDGGKLREGRTSGNKRHKRGKKPRGCHKAPVVHVDGRSMEVRRGEGETLQTPHDPDASFGHKGAGYHAHVTETCNNADKPEIITDYEVHGAYRSDANKTRGIVMRLRRAGVTPDTLYADAGYPSADLLLEMDEQGIELCAPVHRAGMPDGMMSRVDFVFKDDDRVTACPQGHPPIDHRWQNANGDGPCWYAYFDGDTCRCCSRLEFCPVRAPNHRAKGCGARETRGNFRLELRPSICRRDR